MERLGSVNPIFDGGGDGRHRKDHSGNLLVQSERELVNKGDVVGDSCFTGEILEVGDVLLETIVKGSVRAFDESLN